MLLGWDVRKVVHQVVLHLEGRFEQGNMVESSGDFGEE